MNIVNRWVKALKKEDEVVGQLLYISRLVQMKVRESETGGKIQNVTLDVLFKRHESLSKRVKKELRSYKVGNSIDYSKLCAWCESNRFTLDMLVDDWADEVIKQLGRKP